MLENLTKRLSGVFQSLSKKGVISEKDIQAATREIRIALLEADVALSVVKTFIDHIKEAALGQHIIQSKSVSVSPEKMIIKIVHEELIKLLGQDVVPLELKAAPPAVILMAGLQGSGKTTSTGKLARLLKHQGKKVLMASLDIYRPAAQEQLAIIGRSIEVNTLDIIEKENPLDITKRALDVAKKSLYDVLILDTAGRLHIDEIMMEEIKAVAHLSNPVETLLVADAMTGQDAVKVSETFHKALPLTGLILTRMDGDTRGGAALSMKAVTGCPIKFLGVGEKSEALEVFDPKRLADRLLDQGDIVSFVEKAAALVDQEEAERMAKKMSKGTFDLNDMQRQLEQMQKMGGISSLLGMLPGLSQVKDKLDEKINDKMIKRQVAIIQSMTPSERKNPKLLNGSRRKRIAQGCGQQVSDINKFMKQFEQMQTMMKRMKNMKGGRGSLKNLFSR
jgi:signal recognition particle subunit SRP54